MIELSDQRKTGNITPAPMSYELLISSIAEVHARTQAGAAGVVNRYLTLRNWFIGAYIVEFEQNGEDRASYGQQLLPRLARDLKKARNPGLQCRNARADAGLLPHLPPTERKRIFAVGHGIQYISFAHRSD
jgi:hypothetical protein